MTRTITEIYADLINLLEDKAFEYTESSIGCSMDSHVINNQMLINMHEILLTLIDNATMGSYSKPYACKKVVMFNTNWWGADSDQQTEIREYLNDGWLTKAQAQSWSMGVDNFIQPIETAVKMSAEYPKISYDDKIFDISTEMENDGVEMVKDGELDDYYDYLDFPAMSDGSYYDPSLVKIDSSNELRNWLDALDSIVLILNSAKFADTNGSPNYDCSLSTYFNGSSYSDKYNISSYFDTKHWHDEPSDTSGTVLEQKITMARIGSDSESTKIYVYSDNVTYSNDYGDTTELKMSEDGMNFGDDLNAIYNNAVSRYPNTHTYDVDISHKRSNIVYNFDGIDYSGGYIQRSDDGTYNHEDLYEFGELFNNVDGGKKSSYIDNIIYYGLMYKYWGTGRYDPEINLGLSLVETRTKDTSKIGENYHLSNVSEMINVPSIDLEGTFAIYNATAIDKEPLVSRTETVFITPID
jgi:hypothetical protein